MDEISLLFILFSHCSAEVPSSVRNGKDEPALGRVEQGCSDLERIQAEEMLGHLRFE